MNIEIFKHLVKHSSAPPILIYQSDLLMLYGL